MAEILHRPVEPIEDPVTFGFWLRALATEEVLGKLAKAGYLDLAKPRKIIDFGAGNGGPTSVLTRLAEQNGSSVEAVEMDPIRAQRIIDNKVLPADRVNIAEGIHFLRKRPESYELITAFAFGPDTQGSFASLFVRTAQQALRPEGQIVVTSDESTMQAVRMACNGWRISYQRLDELVDLDGFITDAVVVEKSNL